MKIIVFVFAALLFTAGCQQPVVCSTPTAAACESGCASILTYRDEGGCYQDEEHFCIRQEIVSQADRCLINPSGEKLIVWVRFDHEELLDQGWRVCSQDEYQAFPRVRCE